MEVKAILHHQRELKMMANNCIVYSLGTYIYTVASIMFVKQHYSSIIQQHISIIIMHVASLGIAIHNLFALLAALLSKLVLPNQFWF